MSSSKPSAKDTPAIRLESLIKQGLDIAKTAHRHRKSLSGDNYYGNRLAELKAEATNLFADLSRQSAGDVTTMAESLEAVFSPKTQRDTRTETARELVFSLRTTWREQSPTMPSSDPLFPSGILAKTNRGYLKAIGRQMNGCYESKWYDACAVMMRRLIEIAIIEAFEAKSIAAKIKDSNGNYFQLTELIAITLNEPSLALSRNARKYLPQLRDVGHMSAHGRFFHAQPEDIERVRMGCRTVVEELLHHAALL